METKPEQKLGKKYPKISGDYKYDKMQICLVWSVEHEDCWYDLLDKCVKKIQCYCGSFSNANNKQKNIELLKLISRKLYSVVLHLQAVAKTSAVIAVGFGLYSEAVDAISEYKQTKELFS